MNNILTIDKEIQEKLENQLKISTIINKIQMNWN